MKRKDVIVDAELTKEQLENLAPLLDGVEWTDGETKPAKTGWYLRDTARFGPRYASVTRYYYSRKFKAWFESDDLKVMSGWQNLPWRRGG